MKTFIQAEHLSIEHQLVTKGFYRDDQKIFTFDKKQRTIERTDLQNNNTVTTLKYPYTGIEEFSVNKPIKKTIRNPYYFLIL